MPEALEAHGYIVTATNIREAWLLLQAKIFEEVINKGQAGTQTDNKKKIAADTQTKPATVTVWRAVDPKKDPKEGGNDKMKFHGSVEGLSLLCITNDKVVTSSEFAKNELPSPSKRCKRFDCWVANDLQA